jgi:hypothetical protein
MAATGGMDGREKTARTGRPERQGQQAPPQLFRGLRGLRGRLALIQPFLGLPDQQGHRGLTRLFQVQLDPPGLPDQPG